jgi:hypothetical protein
MSERTKTKRRNTGLGRSARRRRSTSLRRTPLQRDVLRDVMLSAAECDTWLTLEELGRLTSYPPASISAQLRHLRKSRNGGYRLKKRCRLAPKPAAGVEAIVAHGPLWEYGLDQRRSVTCVALRPVARRAEMLPMEASA